MIKKQSILFSLSIFLCSAQIIASPPANTISRAYAIIASNPLLQSHQHDVNAQRGEVSKSRSDFLPSISLNANGSYSGSDSDKANWSQSSNLGIKENLFDGFGTVYNVKKNQFTLNYASLTYQHQINTTLMQWLTSLITLKRYKVTIRAQQKNLALLNTVYKKSVSKLHAGRLQRSSVYLLQGTLAQFRSLLILDKEQLQLTKDQYTAITGHPPANRAQYPTPPTNIIPKNQHIFLHISMQYNPALRASHAKTAASQANIHLSQKSLYPTLDVNGEGSRNMDSSENWTGAYNGSVQLSANYNFLTGGADFDSIYIARQRYYQDQDTSSQLYRQTYNTMLSHWYKYQSDKQILIKLRAYRLAYQKAVNDYVSLFNQGRVDLFKIIDSERALNSASNETIRQQYDISIDQWQLIADCHNLQDIIKH